jgi:predicted ArsR family transcriptional regulator
MPIMEMAMNLKCVAAVQPGAEQDRFPVVCPIHLGLMQGALEAWNAPVTVDRLEAFVEPDLCLAHIAPAAS